MAWLPDGEKFSKISLFVLMQLTNVADTQTDRQTDRQTPHDSIGRAYASHRAAKTYTAQSFIVSYIGFRFTTAYTLSAVVLRLLDIHIVALSHRQQTTPLTID